MKQFFIFIRNLLGIQHKVEVSKPSSYSVHRMIEIASTNGFVVTEAAVYDSITGKRIEVDYAKARESLKKFRAREYAKDFEDRIVAAHATKAALRSHSRYMFEVLPLYTPDLMF